MLNIPVDEILQIFFVFAFLPSGSYNRREVIFLKMLTTQVNGLLQRIAGNEEEAIEETARLLAQATIGQGRIVIAGIGEMDCIRSVALHGAEPLTGAIAYENGMAINKEDRVWILSRNATDSEALELARQLAAQWIPFGAVAAEKDNAENELADLATTYISTGVTRGLLPGEDGERFVQPHALAALFIYQAVKLNYDEMVADLD